ncbi:MULTISPECIES: flagellar FlbD family protein [unclassified Paenibacillus]|uniref:flagellar FlbD family protein n=1 Tax=unclassified Paenibacillus TaxID=185978 RepID=UPI001C11DA7C|nr:MULTISPECIES: flagellar FlbD family protein [unclassified Paenibacillus]MBU5441771.1 flagellar FlbD family protein [Paenibacillus sp. MSJ-34]CAH0119816.1 Swarming motility protein SwrD [Paenibacillus sp. CECT 9249]
MISVTRLNGSQVWVNALLIESIEETPDTYITLVTGKKMIVLEKADEVIRLMKEYVSSVGVLGATIKFQSTEGSS